jgi:Flp pilus assembly protein TadD
MCSFKPQLIVLLLLTICTAHAQEPVSADDFSQRGISRFEKNDFEGAIADFTKAIEMKGHELEFCFYFRGIALYRRGRLDEAIADLSKAITLKQHPRFYDDRGNLLAQKGDFDAALVDLNRAIELDPKYAKAYGDRGIVRLMRGDHADAELDFKKCFELDKTLEIQLKLVVQEIKRHAVLRAEHQEPADVQIIKFSWNETPSRILTPPSSPVIPVSTSPVSQTGLRVLGNMEKGEPGPPTHPPGLPNPIDPLGTTMSTAGTPEMRVRGVDHKFSALIKNTGSKTITNVQWAYFFVPQDGKDPFAYLFASKVDVAPGKEKNLHDQVTSVVIPANQGKGLSERNRALFKERVVIVRLDYADGSSWHSSGRR